MHSTATLQDGGSVYAVQYHKSGMAYGKIRLKRRVLNHPYGQRVLESSYLPGWPITQTDAVPLSSIQALHRTIRLLKRHKTNNSVSTPVRHSPDNLFRRFVTGSSHQGAIIDEPYSTMAIHQPGVPDKYPKVHHNPNLSSRVLGICGGYGDDDNLSPNAQDPVYPEGGILHFLIEEGALACLIRTLVATKLAVWTGPLHYCALQDLKIRLLRQRFSDQTAVSLSEEARADLQWWFSDLSSDCSAMMVKPEASIVIESDASNSGWGAVCQGVATDGRCTSEEAVGTPSSFSGIAVFSEGQDQGGSFGQIR